MRCPLSPLWVLSGKLPISFESMDSKPSAATWIEKQAAGRIPRPSYPAAWQKKRRAFGCNSHFRTEDQEWSRNTFHFDGSVFGCINDNLPNCLEDNPQLDEISSFTHSKFFNSKMLNVSTERGKSHPEACCAPKAPGPRCRGETHEKPTRRKGRPRRLAERLIPVHKRILC